MELLGTTSGRKMGKNIINPNWKDIILRGNSHWFQFLKPLNPAFYSKKREKITQLKKPHQEYYEISTPKFVPCL